MGRLRWVDLVVVIAYMAGMAAIGMRFSRRQTSTETYFLAKRSVPSWAMGLSLLAAVFPWRRALMPVILAGCLIDFSAGILAESRQDRDHKQGTSALQHGGDSITVSTC